MGGLSDTHAQWLEARNLCIEVAAEMGVSSMGPRIAFPYVLNGKLMYQKVRDPADKSNTRCVPAGIEQTSLWNEDCLSETPEPGEPLIITEGEPDAIAVKQSGYRFVVSLPSGAASTQDGCRSKARRCLAVEAGDGKLILKKDIQKFERIVVLTDGDHDGLLMREAIVELIGDEYCWVPTFPAGTKDANDVAIPPKAGDPPRLHGAEGVRELVDGARPVKSDGFIDFITAETTLSPLRPLNCGIPLLDPHFRPVRPSFITIGGQAGHGKSTLVQAILFNLLNQNGDLRASVFHAEGDKTIPVQRAKKFWKGKHAGTFMDQRTKDARDAWIRERLAYISPPQDTMPTFEWVLWAMERQAIHRGRNVFVLDPWNQIVHKGIGRQSKTDYVGDCIYQMKRLADRHGLILIVAHHTTKAMDPRQPPNRYDLADSAHWVNASDHILLGWRPFEDQNLTRLEVAKSKDHDKMGRPGSVWLAVSGESFEIVARSDPKMSSEEKNSRAAKVASEAAVASVASSEESIADPGDMPSFIN